MLSWDEFQTREPEMAKFGEERLRLGVMYIATVRKDGYPRVHPFTPFVGSGYLFAFMYPTSPKGKDLQRNGRYSIHSLVADMNGKNGEFQITGDAHLVSDPSLEQIAVRSCPYKVQDMGNVILFEFKIGSCMTNAYVNGSPTIKKWKL